MSTRGYLGIDAGTQGLSVVFTDESMRVLATGDGSYDMVAGLGEGCYEQRPSDWMDALVAAMADLRGKLGDAEIDVAAIGISGQMHGEVLVDAADQPLKAARLWCDAGNEDTGHELTEAFGVKMPKRITAARWLWTIRNLPDVAAKTKRVTTPGGWIAFCLTGQWNLGIGDAAGMFPIDQSSLDYDQKLLAKFDNIAGDSVPALRTLLPTVRRAGEEAGTLTESMAAQLGLSAGIPVAAAEGDQPASLAGSLIGNAGMVSVSFGTSVCANSVGDRAFSGVSDAIDHFCDPDGKPINMVFLRNGTTYMNTVVEMFGKMIADGSDPFAIIMPQVVSAPADCGGMLALPFMDDEPGLGVSAGGQAMLHGLNGENATAANAVKAAMLATMFNLKLGSKILDEQGFPRSELVLSGGLTRTPGLGQTLADVFDTTVTLLDGADEGCAWGAALMAKYRSLRMASDETSWADFLAGQGSGNATKFQPNPESVPTYEAVYQRYLELLKGVVAEGT
jgi:sugar (pentulose or hexulose) kinase